MRYFILIFTLFTLGFYSGCKKITSKANSEKSFLLFFADTSGILKNECFDMVHGLNNLPLQPCSNSLTGLELPLSITDTASTFLFHQGDFIDTLKISYSKSNLVGNGEYEVRFRVKNINPSARFDSLSTKCIPELSNYCNGDQNLFAVIYL